MRNSIVLLLNKKENNIRPRISDVRDASVISV